MGQIEPLAERQLGVTTNFIALFLLGIIVIYSLRTITIKNAKNRSFYLLLGMSFLEISTHLITTVIQYQWFFGYNTLGTIMYSFVFTVNSFYLISWIVYLNCKLSINSFQYWGRKILLSAPVLLLLILSIVNMFTPVFFSFVDFEYERKPLYDLTLIIPFCYLAYGFWLFLKSTRKRKVYLTIPFCELLIPVVVAHIIENEFLGLCVIPLGNVMTLTILLCNHMRQNLSIDRLTGLYSRKELFDYLESNLDSRDKRKRIQGIMLDMNDFKSINDRFGHLIGDDALMDFGQIIRNSLPNDAIGFRYAGDEFVIIVKSANEQEASNIVQKITASLKAFNENANRKYILSASFGITTLVPDDTATAFIERMDIKMYQEKMARKQNLR